MPRACTGSRSGAAVAASPPSFEVAAARAEAQLREFWPTGLPAETFPTVWEKSTKATRQFADFADALAIYGVSAHRALAQYVVIRVGPRPTTPPTPRPRPAARCQKRAGYATRMTGLGRPA